MTPGAPAVVSPILTTHSARSGEEKPHELEYDACCGIMKGDGDMQIGKS